MLEIAIVVGFFLANFADQMQLYIRIDGALKSKIAGGFQRAMEVMLINRFGAAMYFLSVSLYLESGGGYELFLQIISLSLLVLCFFNSLIFWRLRTISTKSMGKGVTQSYASTCLAAFGATVFGLMGLTIPYVAGILIPEYRLTLANSGFILNSVFTLLIVLIVDKKVSEYIDDGNDQLAGLGASVVFAKSCGLAVVCISFFIMAYLL